MPSNSLATLLTTLRDMNYLAGSDDVPRDDHGRWTGDGGTNKDKNPRDSGGPGGQAANDRNKQLQKEYHAREVAAKRAGTIASSDAAARHAAPSAPAAPSSRAIVNAPNIPSDQIQFQTIPGVTALARPLSDSEVKAVQDYRATEDYIQLNAAEASGSKLQTLTGLRSSIQASKIVRPMTLYRGMRTTAATAASLAGTVGKTIPLGIGFVSTSRTSSVAVGFTKSSYLAGNDTPTMFAISVPAGAHGLGAFGEGEVTLDSRARFKVTGIAKDPAIGMNVIKVTMVHDGSKAV